MQELGVIGPASACHDGVGVTFTTTIGIEITVAALRDKRVSTSLSSYIIVHYLMTSTQPMCSINRKKEGGDQNQSAQ
jgi:hypothetical protein